MGPEVSVAVEHDEPGRQDRKASRIRIAVTNMFQVKIGMRTSSCPGTQVEDRRGQVDAGEDRRESREQQSTDPEVGTGTGC